MKETVREGHFIYIEDEGHMIQLKCGSRVDFDSLQLKNERGNDLVFNIACRWNRNTYQGTVRSCDLTQRLSLGTYMDAEFEILEAPLFGYSVVYYRDESPLIKHIGPLRPARPDDDLIFPVLVGVRHDQVQAVLYL